MSRDSYHVHRRGTPLTCRMKMRRSQSGAVPRLSPIGSACIFEARSRPKSVSTIPNRASASFYSTGPMMGSRLLQVLPFSTYRCAASYLATHPGSGETASFQAGAEPMPPPVGASIGALTSPHPRAHSPTTVMTVPSAPPPPTTHLHHRLPRRKRLPRQAITTRHRCSSRHAVCAASAQRLQRAKRPGFAAIETSLRPLQSLPHQVNSIQQAVAMLLARSGGPSGVVPRLRARRDARRRSRAGLGGVIAPERGRYAVARGACARPPACQVS